MRAEKNFCNLVHSIGKCVTGVISSYAYSEVMYNYDADTESAIEKIIATELTDEILPVRIYSSLLNNSVIFTALCGDDGAKALAEQIALMINCMLGLNLEKITVNTGSSEKWLKASELLKSYGYGKYLAPGNLDYDGFVGEIGENGKEIFSGVCKNINAKPCIYSKIKADTRIDLLSDNAEPESKLLPVALVASDEPALSFSVALGLRSQGLKVEEYISGGSMIEAEEYADIKGITILLWVSGNTVMMKNLKSGERSETTVDKLLQNK